jgi:uncharacterized membrane protein
MGILGCYGLIPIAISSQIAIGINLTLLVFYTSWISQNAVLYEIIKREVKQILINLNY